LKQSFDKTTIFFTAGYHYYFFILKEKKNGFKGPDLENITGVERDGTRVTP
jgi:hypothetical protein